MPSNSRRCGLCREVGHNRRNCPVTRCVVCDDRNHDYHSCPFRGFFGEDNEPVIVQPPPPPPPAAAAAAEPASNRINWDKCGKCGTENTNKICTNCGDKQIEPVPKNENGYHECSICYTNLRELNKVTTKCGHHYCIDCFLSHFNSNQPSSGDCPMCRAKILEVEEKLPNNINSNSNMNVFEMIVDISHELFDY